MEKSSPTGRSHGHDIRIGCWCCVGLSQLGRFDPVPLAIVQDPLAVGILSDKPRCGERKSGAQGCQIFQHVVRATDTVRLESKHAFAPNKHSTSRANEAGEENSGNAYHLFKELINNKTLEIVTKKTYQQRLSANGEPLMGAAIIAKKRTKIPSY